MSLLSIIDQKYILSNLQSSDKKSLIKELMEPLHKENKIKNLKKVLKDILKREQASSTGLADGIAVPHAKTPAVRKLVMSIGISKKGVNFNAIDGKKSYIFFLLLSPPDSAGPHVAALADIARLVTHTEIRNRLKKATSADDIMQILREHERKK